MCVRVFMCVFVGRIGVYVCPYKCVYMHVDVCLCVYLCLWVFIGVCVFVRVCVFMSMCLWDVQVCMFEDVSVFVEGIGV